MSRDPSIFPEREKPLAEAAAAVEAAAKKAYEMMKQIQTTKWWQLITSLSA